MNVYWNRYFIIYHGSCCSHSCYLYNSLLKPVKLYSRIFVLLFFGISWAWNGFSETIKRNLLSSVRGYLMISVGQKPALWNFEYWSFNTVSVSRFWSPLLDSIEKIFKNFRIARRQRKKIEKKMKLFSFLYGVTMGMVTLNYTDHMPDGGLLIDLVKEMVPEFIAIRLFRVTG